MKRVYCLRFHVLAQSSYLVQGSCFPPRSFITQLKVCMLFKVIYLAQSSYLNSKRPLPWSNLVGYLSHKVHILLNVLYTRRQIHQSIGWVSILNSGYVCTYTWEDILCLWCSYKKESFLDICVLEAWKSNDVWVHLPFL